MRSGLSATDWDADGERLLLGAVVSDTLRLQNAGLCSLRLQHQTTLSLERAGEEQSGSRRCLLGDFETKLL